MKTTLTTLLFLLSLSTFANSLSFFPENDLRIPESQNFSGLTEKEFKKLIYNVVDIYQSHFKQIGERLALGSYWKSDVVNAFAKKFKGNTPKEDLYLITIHGGIARHKDMTRDSLVMVVCHEVGHFIGGAPRMKGLNDWASAEGQADYFAAARCLKKVWDKEDNVAAIKNLDVPEVTRNACEQIYKNENKVALCIRTQLAALAKANMLNDVVYGGTKEIALEKPSTEVVPETNLSYPPTQCRLDSLVAGSLCDMDFELWTDAQDPFHNICARKNGDEFGVRPLCWFRPEDF